MEGIKAERGRLLKVERQADELYGYYKQGYYKGRFADLKPVFETIFTENVFYTWSLLDDWLWKLYDGAPDVEHFAYGLIQFYTGRVANSQICRHLCRTEKVWSGSWNILKPLWKRTEKQEISVWSG